MTVWGSVDGGVTVVPDLLDPTMIGKMTAAYRRSSGGAVTMIGGDVAGFETLYRSQVWVRTCVDKLSLGVARLPLKSYTEPDSDGSRERIRANDHPLPKMLQMPWPGGSTFQLIGRIMWERSVYGRARCWLSPGESGSSAIPTECIPLSYRDVKPLYARVKADGSIDGERSPDARRKLIAYELTVAGERMVVPPEQIIEFAYPDGVSPLETLARTLALEDAGQRAAIASFANGVRPSGIVGLDPAAIANRGGKMKDEQIEYLRDTLNAEHGGVDQRFRLAAINAAIRWTPISHSAQEAEMIAHRKLNREECCAVYDIPPPIVHILDNATYSNIDEQHRMLYTDTLGPPIVMIESAFRAQLVDHPKWKAWFGGAYPEFDLSAVLRGDPVKRSESYVKFLQSGYSLNDIRALENLPRIDHPLANAVFYPANLKPVGVGLPSDLGELSIAAARLGLASQYKVVSAEEVRKLLNELGAGLGDIAPATGEDLVAIMPTDGGTE